MRIKTIQGSLFALAVLMFSTLNSGCVLSLNSIFTDRNNNKHIVRVRVVHFKGGKFHQNTSLSRAEQTRFETGDKIKFEFTSNYESYLYVLHRTPDKKLHTLYPRLGAGERKNRIVAYQVFRFPNKGKFVFRAPKGNEYVTFVLSSRRLTHQKIQGFAQQMADDASEMEIRNKCKPRYTGYGYCQFVLSPKGKTLVYEPQTTRGHQEYDDSDYILLPHYPTDGESSHLFLSFYLKHK